MAFFGLSDIKFNQSVSNAYGPLAVLEGTPFAYNALKYPMDVGSADKGHYMVFFVRQQEKTQFSADYRGGQSFSPEVEKSIQEQLSKGASAANRIDTSKVKISFADKVNKGVENLISAGSSAIKQNFGSTGAKLGNAIDSFVSTAPLVSLAEQKSNDNITKSIKNITDKSPFGIMNKTQLTTDSIALYMPDTIQFDSRQSYDGLSPGKELLGQALAAAPGVVDVYKEKGGRAALEAIKKTGALQALGERFIGGVTGAPDTTRLGVFGFTGRVINPMLELIYSAPDFRQFQFEFFFWPRSETEALAVQKIIDRFRFHQAPELEKNAGKQTGLLIPPSEFDIKFFYAGRQNPNIPPISTCVLESIQVNYAPNGWSAYEVPGENNPDLGRTGMPVGIQLSLQFRETTYLTKEDFDSAVSAKDPFAPAGSGATMYTVPYPTLYSK
jgi:hypothetical protein